MGRRIPLGDYGHVSLIHPVLQFSLLMAGMAATIAMITALCGVRFGRKSTAPAADSSSPSDDQNVKSAADQQKAADNISLHNDNSMKNIRGAPTETTATLTTTPPTPDISSSESTQMKELPLPPALQPSYSCRNFPRTASRSSSTRKLDFSLSVKMPRSMSVRKMQDQRKKAKLQKEDSIWTKTIILGERCRVSDDDDDAIIYDNNGNRISAYHKKTQSTLSLSRTSSFIDPNAVPGHQDRDKKIKDGELIPDHLNNQVGT